MNSLIEYRKIKYGGRIAKIFSLKYEERKIIEISFNYGERFSDSLLVHRYHSLTRGVRVA